MKVHVDFVQRTVIDLRDDPQLLDLSPMELVEDLVRDGVDRYFGERGETPATEVRIIHVEG